MVARLAILVYGVVSYVLFLGIFLYLPGFLCDWIVPKTINSPAVPAADGGNTTSAVVMNVLLLSLFAIQHSVMARPAFKEWWTKIIPKSAERSTYVLATNLVLALFYWQWRPLPNEIWSVDNLAGQIVLYGLFALGLVIVLVSTFLIDHFELFGFKQSYYQFVGKEIPPARFKTPFLYQYVRHPLMVGFIIALWVTPLMTVGRLLFAGVTTVYILIAIQIEERDLIAFFGDDYREYCTRTPMLIPRLSRKSQ
ncbi:MAG: isoprenylcysteine carboxylmethyltransferase family protein [Planctomycetes bacterium]|nr:isoprenylcysteine carboxylmethyltransferase family protein [Planctomycetota bacterium]